MLCEKNFMLSCMRPRGNAKVSHEIGEINEKDCKKNPSLKKRSHIYILSFFIWLVFGFMIYHFCNGYIMFLLPVSAFLLPFLSFRHRFEGKGVSSLRRNVAPVHSGGFETVIDDFSENYSESEWEEFFDLMGYLDPKSVDKVVLRTPQMPQNPSGPDSCLNPDGLPPTAAPTAAVSFTFSQQHALLVRMKGLGTPSALRCVFDDAHRTRVMGFRPARPRVCCLCGSGDPFEQCCAPVKEALRTILMRTGE
ncbi:unnamed protein product [Phytomonas sp. Hart1]|nr:unnamed protein product [Phytomonas sp. Hart1]|eukprot:CCW70865.1 unnamed protein product [Phytomonas sp. isolate Hart1]